MSARRAKNILNLLHVIDDLDLTDDIITGPVDIWNDNNACVCWSKNTTTKGLRHVQIRENAVREGQAMGLFKIKHIPGKNNSSDIFTKEDKDTEHYLNVRDSMMDDGDTDDREINENAPEISTQLLDDPRTGGCHVGSPLNPSRSIH